MNKPSDSILILGNLEAMFGILHCIEHRSHGLGSPASIRNVHRTGVIVVGHLGI